MNKVFVFVLVAATMAAMAGAVKEDAKCRACETVVSLIEHYLDQGKTHDEIKKLVEQLCAHLPSQYAEICNSVLDGELEQIIKWIESFTPEEVCEKLGLCLTNTVNIDKCAICELAVQTLEQWVTSETTERQLELLIEQVCDIIGHSEVCKALVEAEIPKLLDWLVNKEDPKTVCTQIHLC